MKLNSRMWAGCLLTAAIAIVAVVVVNAQKDQRKSPQPAFYFEVKIEGHEAAYFRSVSGLKIETEVIEYQEGGDTGPIRKLPGVTRYANIRLSREFTGDQSLYDWFLTTQKPNPMRVDGLLTLVDRHGTQVASWTFTNGFPVKWEAPGMDSESSGVAIETIEIAVEKVEKK
jgi:phage tail-like protein